VQETLSISVGGKVLEVPALELLGVKIVVQGTFLKRAEIFDEYWLERDRLPPVEAVLSELHVSAHRPDLFSFTQRVPDVDPLHDYQHSFENYAVLPLSTFERWLNEQIPTTTRRNVRASEKRGVSVQVCDFDDDYVAGISSIYNESPVRAGRRFWHYGKPLERVRQENGTYSTRSTFLAAYLRGVMVGYMKIVWDRHTAAIMQILSKIETRDARPNNALMAEAVRQACARRKSYLIYERFDYGNKVGDPLTRFKQANGFVRMDVPSYCVPLTSKGRLAMTLDLHRSLKDRLPESVAACLRAVRTKWVEVGTPMRADPQ
jgi:hypothetical protein